MPRLLSALLAAVLLTLTFGVASAAHAEGYKVFHPRQNVVAKQISPGKMRFTNRTPYCVALTVTNRLHGGTLAVLDPPALVHPRDAGPLGSRQGREGPRLPPRLLTSNPSDGVVTIRPGQLHKDPDLEWLLRAA